ncbi:hypothetical protein HH214_10695 [Mucilaginibacter robiniae]|uniref:Uncharacterized protein n=1 Tax=Mucilaginibacter robiniae TaxID=2728022 RepID=A0A7L5E1B7_9SPHI|nr:hypothetical protein [Mucilaginibacter robiniae]QJD96298.1 hypothetical protein HH214_10695 [Mucilaginibacter robiniae]
MNNRIITLCYRKIIDINATHPWDKLVFDDSYMEFKMQAQNFSQGTTYTSYAELLRLVPNSSRLPGLVTPAIVGYVQQLHEIIPDILNNLGRRFLNFKQFQFEIINSSITDKSKHHIAINFYSEPLYWHDTIGQQLLVSATTINDGQQALTDLFQLPSYVNIHTLQVIA